MVPLRAIVPLASGRLTVLSAVGSTTVSTVSNSFVVEPSNVITCGSGR